MAAQRIVIGGGTGFIGSHLGKRLVRCGYEVVNVSRRPPPGHLSWGRLEEEGLPERTRAVVNLAGRQLMDFTTTWAKLKPEVENSRINTTAALSRAVDCSSEKPGVFVLVTGVGAYLPSPHTRYHEGSPTPGRDFFSRLCERWERAATVQPPCRLVIIRSGAVLGRAGGMLRSMSLPFSLGLGGRVGDGSQYLPWIHLEDLSRLVQFSIENEQVSGVLNGVAPQHITNQEFTNALARALNRPALLPLPASLLEVLLGEERASLLTRGQHVIPRRVLELGFQYLHGDIQDACRHLVSSTDS